MLSLLLLLIPIHAYSQELVDLPTLSAVLDPDMTLQIGESSEEIQSLQELAAASAIEGYTGMSLASRKLERDWSRRFAGQDQLRIQLNPVQRDEGYYVMALDRCQQGRPVLCPRLEIWRPSPGGLQMVHNFRVRRYDHDAAVQDRFLGLRHGLFATLKILDLYLRGSSYFDSVLQFLGISVPESRILSAVPESLRGLVSEWKGLEMDLTELLLYRSQSGEARAVGDLLRAHVFLKERNLFFVPEGVRCTLPIASSPVIEGPILFSDVIAGPRRRWECTGRRPPQREASRALRELLLSSGYSLDSVPL